MTAEEKPLVIALVNEWRLRPKHLNNQPGSNRFAGLIGAAVRQVRYGNPPNYNQRLAYRMHKKRRAKLEAINLYGSPTQPDKS